MPAFGAYMGDMDESSVTASQADDGADRALALVRSLPSERLAFTNGDLEGRDQVAAAMRSAGLAVSIDDAFNVVGSLDGQQRLPPLVLGSHTDSVPDPGPFDGALGVAVAIECARESAASSTRLRHPLVVVDFSDEEGTLTWGSWGARALAGGLSAEELAALADKGSSLSLSLLAGAARLRELGWTIDPLAAARCPRLQPTAYLELHVEQGPVLERRHIPTAAVTAIVGIDRYEVHLRGASGHAGTVPMADRDDAVVRAAGLIREFWAFVIGLGDRAVANVGRIEVTPGAFNVIPSEVILAIETRSDDEALMTAIGTRLSALAEERGGKVVSLGHDRPLVLSRELRAAILEGAGQLGLACTELPSWAGHDAAVFAPHYPSGMIFVPSAGGVSHSPLEDTHRADIADGLRLLLVTLRRNRRRLRLRRRRCAFRCLMMRSPDSRSLGIRDPRQSGFSKIAWLVGR